MQRRPKALVLMTRSLTALLTVWCLGCSGYEPLLNTMLGRASGMSCASETQMEPASNDASAAGPAVAAPRQGGTESGFDCGCGSCHAASPAVWTFRAAQPDVPLGHTALHAAPLSVTLALAAPPPKPLA